MSEFRETVESICRRAMRQVISEHEAKRFDRNADVATSAATKLSHAIEEYRTRYHTQRVFRWSQRDISKWQNETFGEPKSNLGIAIRANEEMAELLRCLAADDTDPAARLEVADVVIVLCRLVERLGGTMAGDVDAKMDINAKRTWKRRGDGHGQHVRNRAADLPSDELIDELRMRGINVTSK